LPFPYTVAVAAAVAVACLFAVYGCNGTEFSYVIFTEQRNFKTAERRNGNGMMETGHNPARRRVTWLIRPTMLPLSQTATMLTGGKL